MIQMKKNNPNPNGPAASGADKAAKKGAFELNTIPAFNKLKQLNKIEEVKKDESVSAANAVVG